MKLKDDVLLGALQLSIILDKPIYVYMLSGKHHNLTEKPLPPNIPQWRMYPIGQLEFHSPVAGANEYFFSTIERNVEMDARLTNVT